MLAFSLVMIGDGATDLETFPSAAVSTSLLLLLFLHDILFFK